jgi:hypothetical protein
MFARTSTRSVTGTSSQLNQVKVEVAWLGPHAAA